MLNYDEIVTQTEEHRRFLLDNAEQVRVVQAVSGHQADSLLARFGRQLIRWGEQLQGEKSLPTLPVSSTTSH